MKKLLSLLVFLTLMGSLAYAMPTFPMIISGSIINEGNSEGIEVTLINVRTGEEMVCLTDSVGYFQFNPQNMVFGIKDGDDFEIEVEGETLIIDDFNYNTYAPYETEFDLTGKICPPLICPKDTTPYAECDSCCPEDTTPYESCESCCPEDDTPYVHCDSCCEDCPPPTVDAFWILVAGILSAVGGAGVMFKYGNNKIFTGVRTGMKTYRGQNGELKIKHKHPGTRGYHNPEIMHRKPETHPKGMIDVSGHYEKVDGEWRYK